MGWEDYDDYIDYSVADLSPEKPRVRKLRASRPFYRESCSNCQARLIPDENWRRSLVAEGIYLCSSCWSSRYNEDIADRVAQRRVSLLDLETVKISRRAVWGRDEGHCRIGLACDFDFVPFEQMQLDHIIPVAKGGAHVWGNVQTSCAPCNQSKYTNILR